MMVTVSELASESIADGPVDALDAAVPPTHQGAATPHGHQASLKDGLAFVNTLEYDRGRELDHLATLESALAWLFDHGLLHRQMRDELVTRLADDEVATTRLLRRFGRVRAAIRELLVASVERRSPTDSALGEVNRALRVHYVTYLVPAPDGVSLDHRHEGDPVEGALGRLAESVARELTQGRPERLRVCENPECRWIFVDTSHSGRRKWCDMRTCGNRVKVARHRQRRREEHTPSTEVADSVA
jgi:predicted RNA-binding Zn ribbon-like protein